MNALWPQTVIATDALKAFAGDAGSICDPLTNIPVEELSSRSRHPAIMADAAYCILNQEAASFTYVLVHNFPLLIGGRFSLTKTFYSRKDCAPWKDTQLRQERSQLSVHFC